MPVNALNTYCSCLSDEDFGYITVEAMLSHKPVIVGKDSGEPAHAGSKRRVRIRD